MYQHNTSVVTHISTLKDEKTEKIFHFFSSMFFVAKIWDFICFVCPGNLVRGRTCIIRPTLPQKPLVKFGVKIMYISLKL